MKTATTPEGAAMVVLTAAEYAALAAETEDAADIAAAKAASAADAGAPRLPAALMTEVVAGRAHPLAAWRRAAGLTEAELAARAGLRPATVSDIERGAGDPRLSSLRALADALGLGVDDII